MTEVQYALSPARSTRPYRIYVTPLYVSRACGRFPRSISATCRPVFPHDNSPSRFNEMETFWLQKALRLVAQSRLLPQPLADEQSAQALYLKRRLRSPTERRSIFRVCGVSMPAPLIWSSPVPCRRPHWRTQASSQAFSQRQCTDTLYLAWTLTECRRPDSPPRQEPPRRRGEKTSALAGRVSRQFFYHLLPQKKLKKTIRWILGRIQWTKVFFFAHTNRNAIPSRPLNDVAGRVTLSLCKRPLSIHQQR